MNLTGRPPKVGVDPQNPPTQVEKLLSLFAGIEIDGTKYRAGPAALAAALRATGSSYNRAAIYKWTWPIEKSGTGGIIPTRAIPAIEKAARVFGIYLPPGFLDPRGQKIKPRKVRSDLNVKAEAGK